MTIGMQFSPAYLLEQLLRLLSACVLAGFIGFEREFSSHKPAGFRTHILVGLGSAVVMMTSEYAVLAFPNTNIDPTRIGAQVVSGIGFLGAGAILRSGLTVKGLTTAASLWAVACLGLACGIGFYSGAFIATALVWVVLALLKVLEVRLISKNQYAELHVDVKAGIVVVGEIQRMIADAGYVIRALHVVNAGSEEGQQIHCVFEMPKTQEEHVRLGQIMASIQALEGVTRIYA
jgi:putative Mg2+ transporter-C (MgtC) family protein